MTESACKIGPLSGTSRPVELVKQVFSTVLMSASSPVCCRFLAVRIVIQLPLFQDIFLTFCYSGQLQLPNLLAVSVLSTNILMTFIV